MKLLIADDDLISRTVLTAMTEQWGFDPVCAEDGEAAWDLVQELSPPLVLLDWEMPRLNGLDLCARIVETCPKEQSPYIIMLTAHGQVNDLVKGLEMGANDFISKPYDMMELRARLNVGKRVVTLQHDLLDARARLQLLASVDELTGVYNRRSFNERLEEEWSRAMRQSEKLSVALVDVDHFKLYNDFYGHIFGDTCLRSVAQELGGSLKRSTDFFARYGGEEFVFILPYTNDLTSFLDERRLAVERLHIKHQAVDAGFVTVSIGGASLIPRRDHYGMADFLQKADGELYKAKERGRNRVSVIDLEL